MFSITKIASPLAWGTNRSSSLSWPDKNKYPEAGMCQLPYAYVCVCVHVCLCKHVCMCIQEKSTKKVITVTVSLQYLNPVARRCNRVGPHASVCACHRPVRSSG